METLAQNGLSTLETGLVLLVLGLLLVMLPFLLKQSKEARDQKAQELETLIESLTVFREDQTRLRGQIENMSKGQETARNLMADKLQAQEREIRKALEERLADMTRRVGDNLEKSTDKTSKSLTDLQKRLAVIDAAQRNITDLSSDIVGLQDILSNKQARGAFGQRQMEDIVRDILPADYFSFEATLSNSKRVDCLISLPGTPGPIGVDSKYPLEAFIRLREATTDEDRKIAGRDFARDVNKHIRDIAAKYVIPGETFDMAIMFLAAESVYMELHANFPRVIEEGQRLKVLLASPSTFWAHLNSVRALIRTAKTREHAGLIQKEVELLIVDVSRLDGRVSDLSKHFVQASKDIEKIQTSTSTIVKHGTRINEVELQDVSTETRDSRKMLSQQ